MADATGAPGSAPPSDPTSNKVEAPYSPACAANDEPFSHVIAETVAPYVRAFVRSSSDVVVSPDVPGSTTTQMFEIAMMFSYKTLIDSRNVIISCAALPSSTCFSPAARDSAATTEMIC